MGLVDQRVDGQGGFGGRVVTSLVVVLGMFRGIILWMGRAVIGLEGRKSQSRGREIAAQPTPKYHFSAPVTH